MRTLTNSWRPPFCPNPKCRFHNGSTRRWPFKKIGFAYRIHWPFRNQRFLCKHCKRSFSRQTFSATYWQKRPDLDLNILPMVVACCANRQIARTLRVAPSTIDRHLARLGRHCLLFHMKTWQQAQTHGPLVVDGFETFEFSQYFPFHHNLAIEAETGFFPYFTDSELRRKGRMTDKQKRRRELLEARLGRPAPDAVRKGMLELLSVTLAKASTAVVRSDDHRSYPWAIRRTECQIVHEVTSSQQLRDARNPLFMVNRVDNWIRHSSSNHKRETIAWSKRRSSSSERLAVLLVHWNYVKSSREKIRGSPTAAMLKGVIGKPLTWLELLRERLFRSRIELPRSWSRYYDRVVETRALQVNRRHELTYAY
jgi:transposase-like protein